jgi:hypothetical protein
MLGYIIASRIVGLEVKGITLGFIKLVEIFTILEEFGGKLNH